MVRINDYNVDGCYWFRIIECKKRNGRDLTLSHSVSITAIAISGGNIMAENTNKIEDGDIEKVSGGGIFSAFSNERYAEAGVEVVGAGTYWNDGYILVSSREELTAEQANWAVNYYDKTGVPASSLDEIRRFFKTISAYR